MADSNNNTPAPTPAGPASLYSTINQALPDTPAANSRITPADVRAVLHEMLPQARTGQVVSFDRDADYALNSNGTFSVDTTIMPVFPGVVVFAYVAANAAAPSLPGSLFELVGGAYRVGVPLMYAFRVRSASKIQYTITQLP